MNHYLGRPGEGSARVCVGYMDRVCAEIPCGVLMLGVQGIISTERVYNIKQVNLGVSPQGEQGILSVIKTM